MSGAPSTPSTPWCVWFFVNSMTVRAIFGGFFFLSGVGREVVALFVMGEGIGNGNDEGLEMGACEREREEEELGSELG